jgi:hypothetical protein
MTPRRILWLVLAAIWLIFFSWYTSFGGPLSDTEIDRYLAVFEQRIQDTARLAQLRAFLESDTGDDFVVVNAIDYKKTPGRVEGVREGAGAQEILDHYMAYMWPALLSRACHPVMAGEVASLAIDTWGIEGAEEWSMAGLMRYRSRRDMMEIVANPDFGDSHVYKIAAMEKTIAFPIDPWFQLGDPRLLLALLLAIVGLTLDRWLGRDLDRR